MNKESLILSVEKMEARGVPSRAPLSGLCQTPSVQTVICKEKADQFGIVVEGLIRNKLKGCIHP